MRYIVFSINKLVQKKKITGKYIKGMQRENDEIR